MLRETEGLRVNIVIDCYKNTSLTSLFALYQKPLLFGVLCSQQKYSLQRAFFCEKFRLYRCAFIISYLLLGQ